MKTRLLAAVAAAALVLTACDSGGTPNASGSPFPSTAPTATPAGSPTSPAPIPAIPTPASAKLKATVKKFGAQKLAWRGCNNGFECGKLVVPLDYDKPDGTTITIEIGRLPARDKARRIGSLVMNPGGPGGSGMEFLFRVKDLLPDEMLDRFDSVSFDPRGVGDSSPVDCVNDRDLDALLGADPSPDDQDEHTLLVALNRAAARRCGTASGPNLLAHVGTVDAVRDIDVLRVALGEDKISYLGFSYGTLLGARYAQQFPDNFRAMVLDGAIDPVLTPQEVAVAQAVGFERALDAFFADCVKQRCAFAQHGDIGKTFDTLAAKVDKTPLAASRHPGRRLGPGEWFYGVASGLYSPEFGWPVLRGALESAYKGDGSDLLTLSDNLVERDSEGHYSNSVEALSAVSCVDAMFPKDVASYDKDAEQFAKNAPRFGAAIAYGPLMCAFWPVPPNGRPGVIRLEGPQRPILVVGTLRDPATPYEWSQGLAEELPAALLTYDGDGHTAYGYGRSPCVEGVVDAFLLALTVPKQGTRC